MAYDAFQPFNTALNNFVEQDTQGVNNLFKAQQMAQTQKKSELEYENAYIQYQKQQRLAQAEEETRRRINELSNQPQESVTIPNPAYGMYQRNVGQIQAAAQPQVDEREIALANAYMANPSQPMANLYNAAPNPYQAKADAEIAKMKAPAETVQAQKSKPTAADIAYEVYSKAGLLDEAQKIKDIQVKSVTADQWLNVQRKLVEKFGGENGLANFDATLGSWKKIEELASTMFKQDPSGKMFKNFLAQNPQLGVDPDMVTVQGGVPVITTVNGVSFWQDPTDRKWHVYEPKNEGKAVDTVDLGDKVKFIPRDGSAPYYEPKAVKPDTLVRVSGSGGAGIDKLLAREAVKDIPKLRREARTAEKAIPRLNQMTALLDRGAAGGLKGNALALIGGIFDVQATSEAELFKKLASAGAGQMRASVIGPGQVSNYEQSLLQSVSGGGNGARTAIKQLLLYYKQEANKTISDYNDALDSAETVAPGVSRAFGGGGVVTPRSKGAKSNDPMGIR